MNNLTTSSPLVCDCDSAAEFLAEHDEYIKLLAQKKVQRCTVSRWTSDLEADELAQRVRIKLWQILHWNRY